jgi:hypothetical protein
VHLHRIHVGEKTRVVAVGSLPLRLVDPFSTEPARLGVGLRRLHRQIPAATKTLLASHKNREM